MGFRYDLKVITNGDLDTIVMIFLIWSDVMQYKDITISVCMFSSGCIESLHNKLQGWIKGIDAACTTVIGCATPSSRCGVTNCNCNLPGM